MLGPQPVRKAQSRPRFPLVRACASCGLDPAALPVKRKPARGPVPAHRCQATTVWRSLPSAAPARKLLKFTSLLGPMSQGDCYRHNKLLDDQARLSICPSSNWTELWNAREALYPVLRPRPDQAPEAARGVGPPWRRASAYTGDRAHLGRRGRHASERRSQGLHVGAPDDAPPTRRRGVGAARRGQSAPLRVVPQADGPRCFSAWCGWLIASGTRWRAR